MNRHDLGGEMAILEDEDGMHYFEHMCARTSDRFKVPQYPIIIRPTLANHTRTGPLETITIRASIACADCNIHGWVTDGKWTA